MNNYYLKLINNLDNLGLYEIKASLETVIHQVNKGEIDFTKALYELTEREIILKQKILVFCLLLISNMLKYLKLFGRS